MSCTSFDAPGRSRLGLPRDWIFHASIILSALIVLGYIYLGGLTSAIYNEVLQFFLIVAGFLPLVLLGLKNVGGWYGLRTTSSSPNRKRSRIPGSAWSTPAPIRWASSGSGW